MNGWPYVTRVDARGVHRTGPWQPWRTVAVRTIAAAAFVVAAWTLTRSIVLTVLAAGVAVWAWRATR